jgi:predicted Zn-dependent peptidase
MSVAIAENCVLRVQVPPYERVVLDNGAVLLLMELRQIPLVAFEAIVRGGALADPPGKWGAASTLASLLEKGAGGRDAFAFADAVADVGGVIAAEGGVEGISVAGEFLARDQALMIELLADLLQRPRLEPEEFDKLRERQIELIRAAKDGDLSALLPMYGAALLFGDHPYGRPVAGSERSLEALEHADLVRYYRGQVGADRLIVAVAGDFDARAMRSALEQAFGGWRRAPVAAPEARPPASVTGRRVLLVDAPASVQTYFSIGNVGVARGDPRRAAIDVVNTLLGGRFTSMLNVELRIRTGLTYGARSQLVRLTEPGPWSIVSFTPTESTERAIDLALDVFARLKAGAIDAAMVESASRYVQGQFPTRLETAPRWAAELAQLELYGLNRSYVENYGPALAAVTVGDAARVAAEAYPSGENLTFAIIGDARAIRDVVAKYGPVTELPLAAPVFSPSELSSAAITTSV